MSDEAIQRRVAEGDDEIRIRRDVENDRDVVYLPEVPYYDTQAGAIEFALDREYMISLHYYLGLWLDATEGIQ